MTVPAKFKEYIWLVNTIHRFKKMTFAEINRKWLATEMSEGIDLARSTFNRILYNKTPSPPFLCVRRWGCRIT